MNISIDLDQEQTDALAARVAEYNAGSGEAPLTPEEFLTQVVVQPEIDRFVKTAYAAALAQIGEDAAQLPYANRLALIAQVRSQLPG